MSTADIRDRQLRRCCDALAAVDPGAATLCAGWSAHDLALHLWSIKREPLAWAGMVLPVLAPLTRQRAELIRRRWPYGDLVDQLRSASGAIACMPLDRWEDHRHALGEYYVHTQDVARPHGVLQRAPDDELQEALWLPPGPPLGFYGGGYRRAWSWNTPMVAGLGPAVAVPWSSSAARPLNLSAGFTGDSRWRR